MTAAKRFKRVVMDAEESELYLGGVKVAMFARRCTFSSTPRTETSREIDGDSTKAAVSGRLAERCVKEVRGNRLGRRGRVKMNWKSEVYASKNESECDDSKVFRGCVRRGARSGIEGESFSSTGYMRVIRSWFTRNNLNPQYFPELLPVMDKTGAVKDSGKYRSADLRRGRPMPAHLK